ncbi:hypothetical protein ACIA2T_04590 [Amycolatopsis japonica]|uniref:hypothetical protein n=1 Tax=Amycolatopsis japonica TaxID=208439 RepID=UPI0037BA731B
MARVQHQQRREEATEIAVKRRAEAADAEMRRLIANLNNSGRPGLVARARKTHEERFFSKKTREVKYPRPSGWSVGPLIWYWNYKVYGDDITGEVATQSAVLPGGEVVEMNVGSGDRDSESGVLRFRQHVLQTERINAALACHLDSSELPQWREGTARNDDLLTRLAELEKVNKNADGACFRATEGQCDANEMENVVVALDQSASALCEIVRTVEAMWLTGFVGDRIVKAQELASLTRNQLGELHAGRTRSA